MSSLAIAGFHGGSLAISGFSGLLGEPEPPVVTFATARDEFGAGTVTGLAVASGQVIVGPWQTTDRTQLEIKVHARGTVGFNLNYEFSTDKGSTWYVGTQRSSATVSEDDGAAYPEEAHFHVNVGYWWRISVFNKDASNSLDIAFEWRFHEY